MKAVLLAYPNTSLVYNTHWKKSGWQGRQGTWKQNHFRNQLILMRPRRTEGRGGLNEVLNQPVATLYLVS